METVVCGSLPSLPGSSLRLQIQVRVCLYTCTFYIPTSRWVVSQYRCPIDAYIHAQMHSHVRQRHSIHTHVHTLSLCSACPSCASDSSSSLCTVLLYFTTAVATALGLVEGSELVDPTVPTAAINYLIGKQRKSGKFQVIGRVHNYYLLVC